MGKVLTVNVHCVNETTYLIEQKLFHKDYGSSLKILGIELDTGSQVHFCLSEKIGNPTPMIGVVKDGEFFVDVPDNLLSSETKKNDYEIYAFVYMTDDKSGWTVHKIVIPVEMRPNGAYENPTSEEKGAFDLAVDTVKEYVKKVESSIKQINENTDKIEDLTKRIDDAVKGDFELNPATTDKLGGVKAKKKTASDTVEVSIGEDGRLYVPTYPKGQDITVDNALNEESENPVQNKVIAKALKDSKGIFVVEYLKSTNKMNKTYEEVKKAYTDGKVVILNDTERGKIFNLSSVETSMIAFTNVEGINYEGIFLVFNNTCASSSWKIAKKTEIPTVQDILNALPTWQGGAY